MRISVWSSDVCSSDLSAETKRSKASRRTNIAVFCRSWRRSTPIAMSYSCSSLAWNSSDRKSVVEGKSVSVRVELGGRRIIKKQKNILNKQLDLNNIKYRYNDSRVSSQYTTRL